MTLLIRKLFNWEYFEESITMYSFDNGGLRLRGREQEQRLAHQPRLVKLSSQEVHQGQALTQALCEWPSQSKPRGICHHQLNNFLGSTLLKGTGMTIWCLEAFTSFILSQAVGFYIPSL